MSDSGGPPLVHAFRDTEIVLTAIAFVVAARVHQSSFTLPVGICFVAWLVLSFRKRLSPRIVSALTKCLVVMFLAVIVSARADSLLRGLRVEGGPISFVGTLRSDPTFANGATTAVVEVGSHRYRLTGRGFGGASLRGLSAGNTIAGDATIRNVRMRSWRIAKHLSGDLQIKELHRTSKGNLLSRSANSIRSNLLASSKHFNPSDRALFAGFVLGDARDQPVWITDEFRAAGLTHL
jgi:hypothetical protein